MATNAQLTVALRRDSDPPLTVQLPFRVTLALDSQWLTTDADAAASREASRTAWAAVSGDRGCITWPSQRLPGWDSQPLIRGGSGGSLLKMAEEQQPEPEPLVGSELTVATCWERVVRQIGSGTRGGRDELEWALECARRWQPTDEFTYEDNVSRLVPPLLPPSLAAGDTFGTCAVVVARSDSRSWDRVYNMAALADAVGRAHSAGDGAGAEPASGLAREASSSAVQGRLDRTSSARCVSVSAAGLRSGSIDEEVSSGRIDALDRSLHPYVPSILGPKVVNIAKGSEPIVQLTIPEQGLATAGESIVITLDFSMCRTNQRPGMDKSAVAKGLQCVHVSFTLLMEERLHPAIAVSSGKCTFAQVGV